MSKPLAPALRTGRRVAPARCRATLVDAKRFNDLGAGVLPRLVPARLVPAQLVLPRLVPARLVPARLVPAQLMQSGGPERRLRTVPGATAGAGTRRSWPSPSTSRGRVDGALGRALRELG
ncbi:hypothetical protein [Streptomyces cinerochromogenes]|uniref:hypothetical protein n=1 Tax=Streptomyces cinerochromogenes TaxID=66422 RepID=UPI003F53FE02